MKRYQLEVTEEQLQLIANAVEDWHHFLAGYTELYHATSMVVNGRELQEEMKKLQKLVTPELWERFAQFGYGASYSWDGGDCPNKHQRKAIAMSYGIYREIIHFLTTERGENNVYSSPTLSCKDSLPLPIIKVIKTIN